MTRETYKQLIESKLKAQFVEKKKHKKYGTIKSSFAIYNDVGYYNFIPLDEHDRAVLSVCVSNWLAGDRYITPAIITVKNYVMRRIQEIKLHKQLKPILTFSDIFQKCRIEHASKKAKMDVRNATIKFSEHLKAKGEIKSFEFTKKRNAFYSVRFSY